MNIQALVFVSIGLNILLLIALGWVFLKLNKLDQIRKEFLTSDLGKDLEQVLVDQNRSITHLRTDHSTLNERVNDLIITNQLNLQKVGFIRFNPFENDGGNISFSLALMNAKNDGVIISSLHSRDGTRVYAKNIKNGKSESKLTTEETNAITNAS